MAVAQSAPAFGVLGYIRRAATSSLGAKLIMAVTGLMFLVWLVLHMLGNSAMFAGAEKMNQYGHFLKSNPGLLWGQRLGLLVIVGLHVWSGLRLAALNRAARPEQYAFRKWRRATLASRTMAVSGIIVLAFLLFHLAHFTMGLVNPEFVNFRDPMMNERHDIYRMVVTGFASAPIALFYVVAVALVGLHLSHGFWSAFQSLGINGRRWTPFATNVGRAVAAIIALGFAVIPLSILFGVLR